MFIFFRNVQNEKKRKEHFSVLAFFLGGWGWGEWFFFGWDMLIFRGVIVHCLGLVSYNDLGS